jgi:BirA family transcriptional regulator, biotin operon repressor / biotin---[acetyl-CoA-carboxylase] ligase
VTAGFWRLRSYPSIGSTSDLCTTLAAAGEPEGLAVMALRQTAGRGSRGRNWQSPVGNLYISVLLRPPGMLSEGGRWALLAAVALADALSGVLPDPGLVSLKWPNDVLLDGRKVAGILLDATATSAGAIDWLVIGCGVNLSDAPQVPGRRTACVAELAAPPTPKAMAERLLDRLAHWRAVRALEGFGPVRAAWLARAQPVGTKMQLAYNGRLFGGAFAGLADDGSLLLTTGGRVEAFATGEILLQADRPAGG